MEGPWAPHPVSLGFCAAWPPRSLLHPHPSHAAVPMAGVLCPGEASPVHSQPILQPAPPGPLPASWGRGGEPAFSGFLAIPSSHSVSLPHLGAVVPGTHPFPPFSHPQIPWPAPGHTYCSRRPCPHPCVFSLRGPGCSCSPSACLTLQARSRLSERAGVSCGPGGRGHCAPCNIDGNAICRGGLRRLSPRQPPGGDEIPHVPETAALTPPTRGPSRGSLGVGLASVLRLPPRGTPPSPLASAETHPNLAHTWPSGRPPCPRPCSWGPLHQEGAGDLLCPCSSVGEAAVRISPHLCCPHSCQAWLTAGFLILRL